MDIGESAMGISLWFAYTDLIYSDQESVGDRMCEIECKSKCFHK